MATTTFEKPMGTEIESLKDDISELNSKIAMQHEDMVLSDKVSSSNSKQVYKSANVFSISLDITIGNTAIPAWETVATASTIKPSGNVHSFMTTVYNATGSSAVACSYPAFGTDGKLAFPIALSANTRYIIRIMGI